MQIKKRVPMHSLTLGAAGTGTHLNYFDEDKYFFKTYDQVLLTVDTLFEIL